MCGILPHPPKETPIRTSGHPAVLLVLSSSTVHTCFFSIRLSQLRFDHQLSSFHSLLLHQCYCASWSSEWFNLVNRKQMFKKGPNDVPYNVNVQCINMTSPMWDSKWNVLNTYALETIDGRIAPGVVEQCTRPRSCWEGTDAYLALSC